MPAPTQITAAQLNRLIGTPDAPVLIDLRIDEDFAADPRLIPGARRHSHTHIENLATALCERHAVLICHKGQKLSEGAAAILRMTGTRGETLEGGHLVWSETPELPLIRAAALPDPYPHGPTR